MENFIKNIQKKDWIWLLSLIIIYTEKIGDSKAKDFWNWCIEYHKPEGMDKI